MQTKNVAFVGAMCITIGWLLASVLTPPVAQVQVRPQPAERESTIPDASKLTEELQLKLRQLPAAPAGRRNPFVFAERAPEVARSEPPADETATELPPPAPPPGPPYILSGIAITSGIRSAVLTTGADVHIVKVDDVIGGYTVVEVTESSVTLVREGRPYTIRFQQ
jgi:hypothetical protein